MGWRDTIRPGETDLSASGIRTRQSDSVGSRFAGKSDAAGFSRPIANEGQKQEEQTKAVLQKGDATATATGKSTTATGQQGAGISQQPITITANVPDIVIDRDKTIAEFSPWVKMNANEAYNNYKDLTPAQYLRDLTAYKKAGDEELSYADVVSALDGRNPNKSENDLKKERRRYRAASAINSLGTVLANLFNVYRTSKGNPSLKLNSLEHGQKRIDELRARNMALDRSAHDAYMSAIMAQRKEQGEKAAADLKYIRDLEKLKMEQNSPLNNEKINTEKTRQESNRATAEYTKSRTAGQQADNDYKPKKQQAELALAEARRQQALASAAKSGKNDDGMKESVSVIGPDGQKKVYSRKTDGEGYINAAYNWIISNHPGYKVEKSGKSSLFEKESSVPTRDEMIDVINRFNQDMESPQKEEKSQAQSRRIETSPYWYPWQSYGDKDNKGGAIKGDYSQYERK